MTEAAPLGGVVIAEPFDRRGIAVLEGAGLAVIDCVGADPDRLRDALQSARGLIVRSETRVDAALLRDAPALEVIARAGVGVDAIDVDAATAAGIAVLNTPSANTIAATEHTFALMLGAMRHVAAAQAAVRKGAWERRPFVGRELFGKTLGIVGLGRIGSGVAARAQAFGMRTIAYDPFVPASRAGALAVELVEFDVLLAAAEVVTLHVPLTARTRGMLDARAFARMPAGALVVNASRGAVVDLAALLDALDSGNLAAAAIDVVPEEPPPPQSLSARALAHPRVLATPHLGGSTHEALERIALELAADVVCVLGGRPASGAVNAPRFEGAEAQVAGGFLEVAYRIGALLPQLFDEALRNEIALVLQGDLADVSAEPLLAALLAGALPFVSDRRVSAVNARAIAGELGVRTRVTREAARAPFRSSLRVAAGAHRLVATVLPNGPRIVEIDEFEVDTAPVGVLLLTRHRDVPGMVGHVGTILGDVGANISSMHVARDPRGGDAMMILEIDRDVERAVLAQIAAVSGVESVRLARA